MRRRDAGIPDGYAASKLLYNPCAEFLIVELRATAKSLHPRRIFARHREDERYLQIGNPGEDISYESPVTCEAQPLIAFNSKKFRKSDGGDYTGTDWEGMYIFDLRSHELSCCVSQADFVAPPPYDERGWIREILGLSNDGSRALRGGRSREAPGGRCHD